MDAPPVRSTRRRAGRDGACVLRNRRLAVGDPRRVLEPEDHRRQRVRAVLPRQLRLLGPFHLRPLPRRRDPHAPRARAPRCVETRRDRLGARDRRDLGRPRLLVLAVELLCTADRHRPRRVLRLALAGGRPPRRGNRRRDDRRARPAGRAPPFAERRVGRSVQARHERPGDRGAPPRSGSRHRRLQTRVREPHAPEGKGAEGRGIAQHTGHGPRGNRRPRASARSVALRHRARRRPPPRGPRIHRPRASRLRRCAVRDRRPQPVLQRVLRGPDGVGDARPDPADLGPTAPPGRDAEAGAARQAGRSRARGARPGRRGPAGRSRPAGRRVRARARSNRRPRR